MEHGFALADRSHAGHETLVQGPELECGRLQTRWEHFLGCHRLRSFRRSMSSQPPTVLAVSSKSSPYGGEHASCTCACTSCWEPFAGTLEPQALFACRTR